MSNDLREALGALAAEERAAAPELPFAALLSRARRRRAVRVAITSTAAVVAVGAIAVAAAGLPQRQTPPATTPTSSPTPTPTRAADALPTAVTLERPATCGEPLPQVLQPEGEPELTLSANVPPTLTTDDRLVVDYTLSLAEVAVPTLYVDRPALVVVGGGAVVATGTTPESTATGPQAELDLTACDTGERLGVGAYAVYLVQPLLRIVDGTVTDDALLVVAGPYPLTLEAAFDPHPAVEDLIISPAGLGPLTVGLPPETNPGAAMIALDEDYCVEANGGTWDEAAWGPPGEWVPAGYAEVPEYLGTETKEPFRVAAGEIVARIDILSPLLRTSGGIGLGSTLAELRIAHPDVVEQTVMENWSRAWVLQGAEGTLVFETADDIDGYLPMLREETVVGIRIVAPGERLPLQIMGSGDVVGNCGLA